jgi:hypothetical protein
MWKSRRGESRWRIEGTGVEFGRKNGLDRNWDSVVLIQTVRKLNGYLHFGEGVFKYRLIVIQTKK